jgi:hypothetical protein
MLKLVSAFCIFFHGPKKEIFYVTLFYSCMLVNLFNFILFSVKENTFMLILKQSKTLGYFVIGWVVTIF